MFRFASIPVRLTARARACILAAFVAITAAATPVTAQTPAQPPASGAAGMTRDELVAFARLEVAISVARDSAQFQLALARNKTPAMQQLLRDKLSTLIAEIIQRTGTTQAEYDRKTFLVSTDAAARKIFDALLVQITGVPTPGQVVATAASIAAVKVPDGPVGTHIGHVVNSFGDTPNNQGLLAVALAEAKTAAQHAALAARSPTDLEAMKLHAGHIVNAIDPSIVAAGPGLGYGARKAAMGIGSHIDLAAKAQGASPNVIMHASHVSMSARNTVTRCDQIIALAQQIQGAASASDAAALISQLVSLTSQLTAGADANGDGKIGWQDKEGGLQQAQEHVTLLLAGEGMKPSM